MGKADDFVYLDATAQAELVRTKEVQPTELIEAAIERIEKKIYNEHRLLENAKLAFTAVGTIRP